MIVVICILNAQRKEIIHIRLHSSHLNLAESYVLPVWSDQKYLLRDMPTSCRALEMIFKPDWFHARKRLKVLIPSTLSAGAKHQM
jgi:hypothetical protein